MQDRAANTWGDISPGNLTHSALRNTAARTGEHQDHTTPSTASWGISEQQLDPKLPGDLQQKHLSLLLDKDIPSAGLFLLSVSFVPLPTEDLLTKRKEPLLQRHSQSSS